MTITRNAYPFELISKRLKALADPSRLAILHVLCRGERNVSELVTETGFTQANVSKHLRVLRVEGIVTFRRHQRNVYYSLTDNITDGVCDLICRSLEERASIDRENLERFRSSRHE
jgi:DNA-binding transcriptional ArsR family regulator